MPASDRIPTLGLQPLTRAEVAKLQWCVNGAWFGQPRVVTTIEQAMGLLERWKASQTPTGKLQVPLRQLESLWFDTHAFLGIHHGVETTIRTGSEKEVASGPQYPFGGTVIPKKERTVCGQGAEQHAFPNGVEAGCVCGAYRKEGGGA